MISSKGIEHIKREIDKAESRGRDDLVAQYKALLNKAQTNQSKGDHHDNQQV